MAVAAVDVGEKEPDVVVVLQVKDADAADEGLTKLRDCGTESEQSGGWVIDGDWAIVADDAGEGPGGGWTPPTRAPSPTTPSSRSSRRRRVRPAS